MKKRQRKRENSSVERKKDEEGIGGLSDQKNGKLTKVQKKKGSASKRECRKEREDEGNNK